MRWRVWREYEVEGMERGCEMVEVVSGKGERIWKISVCLGQTLRIIFFGGVLLGLAFMV